MTIRTLIVDDEPHAIEIIKRYSANIAEIEVVDTCHNAIKAFQDEVNFRTFASNQIS